jgi:hypothetical protein
MTKSAPSAMARRMSSPPVTPLSKMRGVSGSASRIGGRSEREAGPASNCRPVWFDSQIASTPAATSRRPSSTFITPFTTKGPSHSARISSMSDHPAGRG